jgi:hypothetical protein
MGALAAACAIIECQLAKWPARNVSVIFRRKMSLFASYCLPTGVPSRLWPVVRRQVTAALSFVDLVEVLATELGTCGFW